MDTAEEVFDKLDVNKGDHDSRQSSCLSRRTHFTRRIPRHYQCRTLSHPDPACSARHPAKVEPIEPHLTRLRSSDLEHVYNLEREMDEWYQKVSAKLEESVP